MRELMDYWCHYDAALVGCEAWHFLPFSWDLSNNYLENCPTKKLHRLM